MTTSAARPISRTTTAPTQSTSTQISSTTSNTSSSETLSTTSNGSGSTLPMTTPSEEQPSSGLPGWTIFFLIAIVLAFFVFLAIIFRKIQKKKQEEREQEEKEENRKRQQAKLEQSLREKAEAAKKQKEMELKRKETMEMARDNLRALRKQKKNVHFRNDKEELNESDGTRSNVSDSKASTSKHWDTKASHRFEDEIGKIRHNQIRPIGEEDVNDTGKLYRRSRDFEPKIQPFPDNVQWASSTSNISLPQPGVNQSPSSDIQAASSSDRYMNNGGDLSLEDSTYNERNGSKDQYPEIDYFSPGYNDTIQPFSLEYPEAPKPLEIPSASKPLDIPSAYNDNTKMLPIIN